MSYIKSVSLTWNCNAFGCTQSHTMTFKALGPAWEPPTCPPGWIALTHGAEWATCTYHYCPLHLNERPNF
jgi:hypothetical protein